MRKLFWACTAGGFALAGGVVGSIWYGAACPASLPGRGLAVLSRSVVLLHPTTGLAPVLADKVWHTGASQGAEDAQEPVPAEGFAEPTPLDEPTPLTEPAPGGSGNVVVASTPAPIVIPDEEPMKPVAPDATVDFSAFAVPNPTAEPGLTPDVCPAAMPYCVDDDEAAPELLPPPRPKATGGEEGQEPPLAPLGVAPACPDHGCPRYESYCPGGGRGHQMYCPHPAGHAPAPVPVPVPLPESTPTTSPMGTPVPTGNEEPTTAPKPSKAPKADTMEYRPGDRLPGNVRPGAF